MNTHTKQGRKIAEGYISWKPGVKKGCFRERVKALVAPEDWGEEKFEQTFFDFFYGRCTITRSEYEELVKEAAESLSLPF